MTVRHDTQRRPAPSTSAVGGLSAVALAALPVVALTALAQALGAAPDAATQLWLGTGGALVAGVIVTLLHTRLCAADDPADARLAAQRLQTLLGLAFATKLLCVAAGVLSLWFAGLKFAQLAAFALAFAGASLVIHLLVALHFGRALSARSAGERARAMGAANSAS
ncbi:MAG: hypothetical protein AB7O97_01795 [Planctomycetota bacterium]